MRFKQFVVFAALVTTSFSVFAQETKKGETKEIRSSLSKERTSTPCLQACTINFKAELGADFGFLVPLGSQIHQARVDLDPVTLAVAAKSLSVAEETTGKKAKVTAQKVMEEAIELAKLRGDAKELKAMSLLASDSAVQSQLTQLAELASDSESESGEATREQYGRLTVDNHTPHNLRIVVDGRTVGYVRSGRTDSFRVHSHRERTHYDAYCTDDNDLVRHALGRPGHWHDLRWHIDE